MIGFLEKLPGVDELTSHQRERLRELYNLHYLSCKSACEQLNSGHRLDEAFIQTIIDNIHRSGPIVIHLCRIIQDPCLLTILSRRYKIQYCYQQEHHTRPDHNNVPMASMTSMVCHQNHNLPLLHLDSHCCINVRNSNTIIKTNSHNSVLFQRDIELLKKAIAIGVDSLHVMSRNPVILESGRHFAKKHLNRKLFDSFQDTYDKIINDALSNNGVVDASIRHLRHIIQSLQRKADFQHDMAMVEILMSKTKQYKYGIQAMTISSNTFELKLAESICKTRWNLAQSRELFFQLLELDMAHFSFSKSLVFCETFVAFSDHSDLVLIKPSDTQAIKDAIVMIDSLVTRASTDNRNPYFICARQVSSWVHLLSLFLHGSSRYRCRQYHGLLTLYRDTIKEPLNTGSLLDLLYDFKFRCIEGFKINYTVLFGAISYLEIR